LSTTTRRWWSRLMSSCRGEFSIKDSIICTSGTLFSLQILRPHALISLLLFSSVSRPDKVFFPPANWKVPKNYGVEQDVGPALVNNGPSRISSTLLELRCPLRIQGRSLLYPLEFFTEGPINCTTDKNMNHLKLKVSISHAHAHLFGSNGAKLEILLHPDYQGFDHIHLLLLASQPHP
ncbi:hypothetical protein XENOCAPTIV_010081, partial [Xenoophorus captivus]